MATKWKNTSEKWKEINARNRDLIMVLGVGAMAGGLFFILMNVIYRGYYSDTASLIFSAIGNVSFGGGSILLVNNFLSRKYGEWKCETDDYYEEWKEKVWEQDKKILKAAGIVLFLACMYLLSIVTEGYVHTGAAYLTVLTAFIQTALYLTVSHRFWQRKLDFIIDHLEEMTEQRISEALEIERKSLEKVSRSDQLRVDLITNVSHDLKTPLTSMVGYIELIKKEELSDVVKDYIDVISERAEKLKEMIMADAIPQNASGINADDVGVQLRINSDAMFKPGSAEFSTEGLKVLTSVKQILDEYNLYLVVRGHADSIETRLPYSSPWELSGARAANAIAHLTRMGIKGTRLRGVCYGDTRPLRPGTDDASRSMNRRVEFYFHRPEVMSYSVVY